MNKQDNLVDIIEQVLNLHEKDKTNFLEISDIFMSLSDLTEDQNIRSFCINASVVIGESMYNSPVGMNYEDLKEEFRKIKLGNV